MRLIYKYAGKLLIHIMHHLWYDLHYTAQHYLNRYVDKLFSLAVTAAQNYNST